MFAPILLKVPGQMTRCPCGFGAYAGIGLLRNAFGHYGVILVKLWQNQLGRHWRLENRSSN